MTETTHHVFHAMGIAVHITLVGFDRINADKYTAKAERVFRSYDERFSRFKESSELYKLNTSNGAWTPVSLEMFQVLRKCVLLANETNGAFDPSVGRTLASYGYGLPKNLTATNKSPTYLDIEFNDRELSVRLATGQVLETASIVKGLAIDKAGDELAGVPGFMINAGGDILTRGSFENGSAWNVAVQDPGNTNAVVGVVGLRNAGMATSGTYQTKGTHDGKEWHHLIDMRTGEPADEFMSATVIASTCEEADTEASLAILLSKKEAIARLENKGLPYFIITKDGVVIKSVLFTALEIPISTLI